MKLQSLTYFSAKGPSSISLENDSYRVHQMLGYVYPWLRNHRSTKHITIAAAISFGLFGKSTHGWINNQLKLWSLITPFNSNYSIQLLRPAPQYPFRITVSPIYLPKWSSISPESNSCRSGYVYPFLRNHRSTKYTFIKAAPGSGFFGKFIYRWSTNQTGTQHCIFFRFSNGEYYYTPQLPSPLNSERYSNEST